MRNELRIRKFKPLINYRNTQPHWSLRHCVDVAMCVGALPLVSCLCEWRIVRGGGARGREGDDFPRSTWRSEVTCIDGIPLICGEKHLNLMLWSDLLLCFHLLTLLRRLNAAYKIRWFYFVMCLSVDFHISISYFKPSLLMTALFLEIVLPNIFLTL